MPNFPPSAQLAQIFHAHLEGVRPWREGDVRQIGRMQTSYDRDELNVLQRLDFGLEQRLIGREIMFTTTEGLEHTAVLIPSLSERIVTSIQDNGLDLLTACYQATLEVTAEFVRANPEVEDVFLALFNGAKGWEGILMANDFGIPLGIFEAKDAKEDQSHGRRGSPIPLTEFRGVRTDGTFGQCGMIKTANAINLEVQRAIITLGIFEIPGDISLSVPPEQVASDFRRILGQISA